MESWVIGLLGLILMLVLIFAGFPTPIAFLMMGFFGIVLLAGWPAGLKAAEVLPFSNTNKFDWTVIPLFVLMGVVLFEFRIGEEIFRALRNWLGQLPGGLASSVSVACAAIGTMTGSGYAATALMAKIAYPEMKKAGYNKELALAVIAGSGPVAMMIPPSIVIVIYAVLAEQSIAQCLLGGFIPGVMSMVIYVAYITIAVARKPSLGPPAEAVPWKEKFIALRYLLPVVLMMATIIGGIYFGIFTASEAAGFGAFIALMLVVALRRMTWRGLKRCLLESGRLSVLIMAALVSINFFVRFLTISQFSLVFSEMALGLPSKWITLAMMMFIMFIFGMFIGGPLMYVTVPLFAPVVESMGFSLVWFGLLVIKMTETGAITPPVCMTLFIAQGIIQEVPMEKAYRAVIPFVFCNLIALAIMIAFPILTLWLPNSMRAAPA